MVAIRECVFDTALPRWACVRERGRVRSPSTGFERDATHCPSRGEHVTVTRTLSRVVDRVEAYIFNMEFKSKCRRRPRLRQLPVSSLLRMTGRSERFA